MNRFIWTSTFVATALFASGCTTRHGIKDSAVTADGQYRVSWWKTPANPLEANEYFELYVEVDGLKTKEPPYHLQFDATMPAHRHGMNTVAVPSRLTLESWNIRDLNLHMPGDWVMTFDVIDDDGVLHRASKEITIQ